MPVARTRKSYARFRCRRIDRLLTRQVHETGRLCGDIGGVPVLCASFLSMRCPFASQPLTPALGETVCSARVGVRWGGRRPGAIRDVYHRRWPAHRVPACSGGNWSEWCACRRSGAGAGASRNAAPGPDLRAADHTASTGRDQRWKAATTGNKAPVSGHSRSLGFGFVGKGQETKLARFCRRSIRAPERKSGYRSGFARWFAPSQRRFIATAVSIATMSGRRKR